VSASLGLLGQTPAQADRKATGYFSLEKLMMPQCSCESQQQAENPPPGTSKQLLKANKSLLQEFSELLKYHKNTVA